jgi:MFS transporter, PHS family, inorganic phosphate transporter
MHWRCGLCSLSSSTILILQILQYPLSAVILTEDSPTSMRAKMLASAFLVHSMGQLAAYSFGIILLALIRTIEQPVLELGGLQTSSVDLYWRVVIASGALPIGISIRLRQLLPNMPPWCGRNDKEATQQAYLLRLQRSNYRMPGDEGGEAEETRRRSLSGHLQQVRLHLRESGHFRFGVLVSVMTVWFIVDLSFHGLGLNSPRTVSKYWLPAGLTYEERHPWDFDPAHYNITISDMLKYDAMRNLVISSAPEVVGSLIFLFAIDYIPRVTWMSSSFSSLGIIFLVNGAILRLVNNSKSETQGPVTVLNILIQVLFNMGPYVVKFIVPAEIFDTGYRGTFYGITAATGKLGAITILVLSNIAGNQSRERFAWLLLALCPTMFVGALVTRRIPDVQYPRGHSSMGGGDYGDNIEDAQPRRFLEQLRRPNRPLEDIATGRTQNSSAGLQGTSAALRRAIRRSSRRG